MNNPSNLTADRVLPGDVIRNHPDTSVPGEWTVTAIHHIGDPSGRNVRLDYTQADGASGCFVVASFHVVRADKGAAGSWLDNLTTDEMRQMLCYLTGYSREGVAGALAGVLGSRNRVAALLARAAEAVSA